MQDSFNFSLLWIDCVYHICESFFLHVWTFFVHVRINCVYFMCESALLQVWINFFFTRVHQLFFSQDYFCFSHAWINCVYTGCGGMGVARCRRKCVWIKSFNLFLWLSSVCCRGSIVCGWRGPFSTLSKTGQINFSIGVLVGLFGQVSFVIRLVF